MAPAAEPLTALTSRVERVFDRPALIALAVAVVVVIPLVVLGERSAADARDRLAAATLSETALFAERSASTISARLVALRDSASLAARSRLVVALTSRNYVELQVVLTDLRPLLGADVVRLSVTDEAGTILVTEPPDAQLLARGLNALPALEAIAPSRLVERPYLSSSFSHNGARSVIEAVPVGGFARGALIAQLDLARTAASLPESPTPTTRSVVVDEAGRFVIGRGTRTGTGDLSSWLSLAELRAGHAVRGQAADPDGRTALVAGVRISEIGWYALATHEPGREEADVEAALGQAAVARWLLAVALIVGSYALARAGRRIARQRRSLDLLLVEVKERNRQLALATKNKSEFLANMSHELRTPLNAVIGFSDVLMQKLFGEVNERQEEYLNDIFTSGKHLLSLVNDILDLSKVEAGKMELQLSLFSLKDVVESGATIVRERATNHSVTLRVDVDPNLPPLEADERKVRQVLFNLLSNAVKFTPAGGSIDIVAQRADGEVRVSVRDTGVGIAPQDHAKIFEEFQQTATGAQAGESTGLGLTLAKRFIELHGGRLWVESQVGKGSTFTFALPVRRPAPAPA